LLMCSFNRRARALRMESRESRESSNFD
jgi:hypothetical protein